MTKGDQIDNEDSSTKSIGRDVSDDDSSSSRRRERKSKDRRRDRDRDRKRKKGKRKSSKHRRREEENENGSRSDSDSSSPREESYRQRKKRKRQRRDYDSYSSLSSYESSGDDSSLDDRRRRKKRSKDRKKKSNRKKGKKSKKSAKEKDDKKKKDDGVPYFGKYGILKASDYQKQQRTFTVWLEEVKGIMSFSGPKWELQNYFKEYMEDFNTATLPHIKYYDYDKWEMEEYQKNKEKAASASKSVAQRDEFLHMQSLQEKAKEKRQKELDLVRNMMSKEKREEMKLKAKLQSEMAHAYKTGDQETYLRLKNRLEADR